MAGYNRENPGVLKVLTSAVNLPPIILNIFCNIELFLGLVESSFLGLVESSMTLWELKLLHIKLCPINLS